MNNIWHIIDMSGGVSPRCSRRWWAFNAVAMLRMAVFTPSSPTICTDKGQCAEQARGCLGAGGGGAGRGVGGGTPPHPGRLPDAKCELQRHL